MNHPGGPGRLSRRHFLQFGSAAAVTSAGVGGAVLMPASAHAAAYKGVHTWISPRGTIETMDDYPYWVAREMGYFEDLGVYTKMEAGAPDGIVDIKALATHQADIAFPSPGVFSFAIGNRLDLVSVYGSGLRDLYGIAFREGQGAKDLRQLEGKTILLGSAAWQLIADPLFAAAGVDPRSIKYVEAGWPNWIKALHSGYGDAALTWEGLRAELDAMGLRFDYWLGLKGSPLPSHSLVVRRGDLAVPERKDFLRKYLRGWAMATEFADRNPRAAAQIVFKSLSPTRQSFGPRHGTASLLQVHRACKGDMSKRSGWGEHDLTAWERFFRIAKTLGQSAAEVDVGKYVLNDFIAEANAFSKAKVHADAEKYPLSAEMQAVDLAGIEKTLYADAIN